MKKINLIKIKCLCIFCALSCLFFTPLTRAKEASFSAPFYDIEFVSDHLVKVLVKVDGKKEWYRLERVSGVKTPIFLERARIAEGKDWKKRFALQLKELHEKFYLLRPSEDTISVVLQKSRGQGKIRKQLVFGQDKAQAMAKKTFK